MFFTNQAVQNSRTQAHWRELWAQRNIFALAQNNVIQMANQMGDAEYIRANNAGVLPNEFWKEVDNQVLTMRSETVGMEILDDLLAVQTTLDVGKTAKLYTKAGGIADDVQVTIDGQAPYTFDSVEYNTAGDPIPMFSAGFGVNWRKAVGLKTIDVDNVLDSQAAKLTVYNKKLVAYLLTGNTDISVDGYKGAGIKNHTATQKINLNGGIDLTAADQAALNTFFTSGAFGLQRLSNYVDAYDVVWVSPQVWVNINKPYILAGQPTGRTIQDALKESWGIREFKMTYALTGNEMLGYQRRKTVITPLVGMTTGVVALPRPLPNSNYNFQILGAMGLQVKADVEGKTGTFYAADLG